MIEATSFGGNTNPPSAADRRELGKQDFLTLLVTQLRHQDPLSPLEPHEFAAQLAQFTSVEQLTELNAQVALQTEASHLNALLGKTNFGAALIGRQVVAEGNQVTVPEHGGAIVRFDVGGSGGSGTLTVKDATGHVVATRSLGVLRSGRQTASLPSDLPPGEYTYEVTVAGPQGSAIPVTTFTVGIVEGVSFRNGDIVLRVGGHEISLDSVSEIESAPASMVGVDDPSGDGDSDGGSGGSSGAGSPGGSRPGGGSHDPQILPES